MRFLFWAAAAQSTTEQCDSCNKDVPSITVLKKQICDNAQQKIKLTLASRSGLEAFGSVGDLTCFPLFAIPDSADPTLKTWFDANGDGMQMALSHLIWTQECAPLQERACKSAASHSPCQWKALGGPEGTGQCSIFKNLCVDITSKDGCLDKERCRWIPHVDIADVSHVPCRFVRSFRELCMVYNTNARCDTNKNCKWDVANNECSFNGCVAGEHATKTCACAKIGSDPRKSAPMCHFGYKCELSTDNAVGPYVVSEAECVVTTPPPPPPNSCQEYWADHCKPSATDVSKTWRPLWDESLTTMPSSEPYKKCCRKTCDTWMEDGNACTNTHTLMTGKLCGVDKNCDETICCQPTCAAYDCNINRPQYATDGTTIVKENAVSIPCSGNKAACTFSLCCELTCASRGASVCNELATPPQFLKLEPQNMKCSANPTPNPSTPDGCDSLYCCEVHRANCEEVITNGEAGCGKGSLSDWVYVDNPTSKSCSSSPYLCRDPKFCCRRRCVDYLSENSCPEKEDPITNKDVVCDDNCNLDQCCTKTCTNFECGVNNDAPTGLLPVENAQSIICNGSTTCDFSTCCRATCESHQLSAPQISSPQSCSTPGMLWRDNLASLMCGSSGSSNDCDSETYCCKKTCASFTSTGCPAGYIIKEATANAVCGDAGGPSCSSDYCCIPTCDHFVKTENGGPGCNSGQYANQGWHALSPTIKQCSSANTCSFAECCERTCKTYIATSGTDSQSACAKINQVVNTETISLKCNAGCDESVCCEETCASMHMCTGTGIGYQMGEKTAACSSFEGGCTNANCCEITCAAFGQNLCDSGYIKDSTKDTQACVSDSGEETGTITDCTTLQCCKPTCAVLPSACTTGYIPKDLNAANLICDLGGCNVDTCCDTTCQTYFGQPAVCAEAHLQVPNPGSITCKYGVDCHEKCCKPTCAAWLATQGLGNDPTCGISSVTASNGKTYTGGVKRADHAELRCADNTDANGQCTPSYCCEFTCAKWYLNSCYNTGTLAIQDASGNLACSKNPSPPATATQGLEHLYPCSSGFCCEDPCSVIPACPLNEVKKITCGTLTSCNVHLCCVCGETGSSCLSDVASVPSKSCQPGTGYQGEMKCKDILSCARGSDEIVSASCNCGEKQNGVQAVCRSFAQEHCHPNAEVRCVPACKQGSNTSPCQCGTQMCASTSYCDTSIGQCIPCTASECNTSYCVKYATKDGDKCVPKEVGSALISGGAGGSGLSGGQIALIAGLSVFFVVVACSFSAFLWKKNQSGSRHETMEVDE